MREDAKSYFLFNFPGKIWPIPLHRRKSFRACNEDDEYESLFASTSMYHNIHLMMITMKLILITLATSYQTNLMIKLEIP